MLIHRQFLHVEIYIVLESTNQDKANKKCPVYLEGKASELSGHQTVGPRRPRKSPEPAELPAIESQDCSKWFVRLGKHKGLS